MSKEEKIVKSDKSAQDAGTVSLTEDMLETVSGGSDLQFVHCPYCHAIKQEGYACPKCGRS